jgi:hypothetical protein
VFADRMDTLARGAGTRGERIALRGETVAGLLLLALALTIGLATARHYGITVDEFNTDDYGPKALAWYTSGFTDRSHFETVEAPLWYYGPWFQMLVAAVQSLDLLDPLTVRHALTFLVGLAGLATLLPVARLSVGGWAGPIALGLCLMTGYLYGSLFFTPIDVPFLAAMAFAVLAILHMARGGVPSWGATLAAGLATGLAIATRTGGIITHAFLLVAMALAAIELVATTGRAALQPVAHMALRTVTALAIAWVTAIALWPWLQLGNPFRQFAIAHTHFASLQSPFSFPHWGETVWTNALPWHYVPGQWLARLPEGFLLLLGLAAVWAVVTVTLFVLGAWTSLRRDGIAGLEASLLTLARARGILVVAACALVPPAYVMLSGSTLYDGVRHLLFVLPMLALLAAGALLWVLPLLRRYPAAAAVLGLFALAHVGTTLWTLVRLHPLEYVATNAIAGGPAQAVGRFELDYWSAAATPALRQLEGRLDADTSGEFATRLPHVMVCIGYREQLAGVMFRRPWIVETEPAKADFLIETERARCSEQVPQAVLIDDVTRLGTTFAGIYANGIYANKPGR